MIILPLTIEEFIDKMEWEGGVVGVLQWGGADYFPPELQPMAHAIQRALLEIDEVLDEYENARRS